MTEGLIELRDWLKSAGCMAVAMEATGDCWKLVHNLLERHFDLIVADARHIEAMASLRFAVLTPKNGFTLLIITREINLIITREIHSFSITCRNPIV